MFNTSIPLSVARTFVHVFDAMASLLHLHRDRWHSEPLSQETPSIASDKVAREHDQACFSITSPSDLPGVLQSCEQGLFLTISNKRLTVSIPDPNLGVVRYLTQTEWGVRVETKTIGACSESLYCEYIC